MFGQLPRLFDQYFALGYFLPSLIFILTSLSTFDLLKILPSSMTIDFAEQGEALFKLAVIILIAWVAGIFLMAINGGLIRLMSGKGRFNPLRLLMRFELRSHTALRSRIDELNAEYRDHMRKGQRMPPAQVAKRSRLMREYGERFPVESYRLLPTAFGNIVEASQSYSQQMYSLDPDVGWDRLQSVMKEEHSGFLKSAKANLDFWLNLWLVGIISIVIVVTGNIVSSRADSWLLPILWLVVVVLAYSGSRHAAVEWGKAVKTAYDVFLPLLRNQLGFRFHSDLEQERLDWAQFSQAIAYLYPEAMPERTRPKVEEEGDHHNGESLDGETPERSEPKADKEEPAEEEEMAD